MKTKTETRNEGERKMKANTATSKQRDYLLSLVNAATGINYSHVSQASEELEMSKGQVSRMSKGQASALISRWVAKLEA